MSDSNIRFGKKLFSDTKNFRNGIRRSGHFSVSESSQLEKYGDTLQQLANETLSPDNDDEKRFLSVCKGELAAEHALEKLWLKYLEKTSPQQFHTMFGNSKVKSTTTASSDDIDDVDAVDDE